jgi:radical SAM superfamily enzyme YgiQ (UPF0313 family)
MDVPLGLAYLSAFLKSKGYTDIRLVDFNLFDYDYYNSVDFFKEIPLDADVYGITVTTPQLFWYREIATYIKENNPTALVIAGGPHATARPNECTPSDMVILGEGEEVMHRVLVGGVFEMTNRAIVEDLDSLPFPDRTLTDLTKYHRTILGRRALHVISARDCPFNCSFCSKEAVGRNIRLRSVENFIKEIDEYISKYGIKYFVIYDDTFTVDKSRAKKIALELGKRGVAWRCFSRTDSVDRETLRVFKENGLSSITFGVESFSDKMLTVYNKQNTADTNKRTLKLCKELEIPVRCSLIYGGPYETRETLEETIRGVEETQPDEWNWSTFIPIPGSDVGDNPDKYEIEIYYDPLYLKYDRIGESNLSSLLVKISTMTDEEYLENRSWFVKRLEEVCPRKIIQDTIQDINL